MSEDKTEEGIVKKLDKVADSLESTTSQLSSVVTQQQLDLIRERVSKCESDISLSKDSSTAHQTSILEKIEEIVSKVQKYDEALEAMERDISAVRALAYSSFALSTVAVIGLVICALKL